MRGIQNSMFHALWFLMVYWGTEIWNNCSEGNMCILNERNISGSISCFWSKNVSTSKWYLNSGLEEIDGGRQQWKENNMQRKEKVIRVPQEVEGEWGLKLSAEEEGMAGGWRVPTADPCGLLRAHSAPDTLLDAGETIVRPDHGIPGKDFVRTGFILY